MIYAIFGTMLTQWIGSPLVNLDFNQQRLEADFRFNLVRVRENSEQIALLKGEGAERERLSERFSRVVGNWYDIMSRTKRLTAFTQSYAQAAVVFPFALAGPAYFVSKTVQLGALIQIAEAFGKVQDALSFFVSAYRTMAEWRAVIARLDGFENAIGSATALAHAPSSIAIAPSAGRRDRSVRASGEAAERHAAGVGRRLHHSRRRAHPGDGAVGRGQVDAVPRHCRHLALWQRRDHGACECHADDAAAAALSADLHAEGGDRLSVGGERVYRRSRLPTC